MDLTSAPISLEDAEELFADAFGAPASAFPATYGKGRATAMQNDLVVLEVGSLTQDDVDAVIEHIEAGAVIGHPQAGGLIERMRHTHHRLAQYLAMGMDELRAAKMCNYTNGYVSQLKTSPAFQELLAYYAQGVEEEFADFVSAASDLSMDMLGRLREVLEETPEKLTPQVLIEGIKLLADRTGHAPVMKTTNLNVNLGVGDKMEAIRERLRRVQDA